MGCQFLYRDIMEDFSERAFLHTALGEGLLNKSVGKVPQIKGRASECKCPEAEKQNDVWLVELRGEAWKTQGQTWKGPDHLGLRTFTFTLSKMGS